MDPTSGIREVNYRGELFTLTAVPEIMKTGTEQITLLPFRHQEVSHPTETDKDGDHAIYLAEKGYVPLQMHGTD